MVNQNIQQQIIWPVTLKGELHPAKRGKVRKRDQNEFGGCDPVKFNASLPLIPGNPYKATTSEVKDKRNPGILVTCHFGKDEKDEPVTAQFHRYPPARRKKAMWIGSNRRNGGNEATGKWHSFIAHFGITVGKDCIKIPVELEFHENTHIFIKCTGEPVQLNDCQP